jgi:hypothetical protein
LLAPSATSKSMTCGLRLRTSSVCRQLERESSSLLAAATTDGFSGAGSVSASLSPISSSLVALLSGRLCCQRHGSIADRTGRRVSIFFAVQGLLLGNALGNGFPDTCGTPRSLSKRGSLRRFVSPTAKATVICFAFTLRHCKALFDFDHGFRPAQTVQGTTSPHLPLEPLTLYRQLCN